MPNLFPRKLRLEVVDDDGAGVNLGELSTRFEIDRSAQAAIGRAKIQVINLSKDTVARLEQKYTRIKLDAGYPQRSGTIFSGEIRNVFVTRDGPDRVVKIFAADGARGWENSTVNRTFAAGTPVRTVVSEVAATLGLPLGTTEFLTTEAIVGAYVASGMTRHYLDELADSYGFRWSIQGGTVEFLSTPRSGGTPTNAEIIVSRDTGMVDSPVATTLGLDFLTLLDPRIVPGRRVEVRTAGAIVGVNSFAPDVRVIGEKGGVFQVSRLVHVGESRGQPWYTKAFAVPIVGQKRS